MTDEIARNIAACWALIICVPLSQLVFEVTDNQKMMVGTVAADDPAQWCGRTYPDAVNISQILLLYKAGGRGWGLYITDMEKYHNAIRWGMD